MQLLHAFIDESGDDGFTPAATPWLSCSAYVIAESDKDGLRAAINDGAHKIWRTGTPPDDISFKGVTHERRKALLNLIKPFDFTAISVSVYKACLTDAEKRRLTCPGLYNYICKHIVERLTWFADDRNKSINITVSKRKQIHFETLNTYINFTLRQEHIASHDIKYNRIAGFTERPSRGNRLMQMADWIARSVGAGLNPDAHGNIEPAYAAMLWGKFWMRRRNLWSYGFKCLPTRMNRNDHRFVRTLSAWLEDPTTLNLLT